VNVSSLPESTSGSATPPLLKSVNLLRPPYDKTSRPARRRRPRGLGFDRSGFRSILAQRDSRKKAHSGAPCSSPPRPADILAPFRRRSLAGRLHRTSGSYDREGVPMSSVVKKRRKKMRKHKHRKMLKKTRWQRKHKG
jgi:hypothetical protein